MIGAGPRSGPRSYIAARPSDGFRKGSTHPDARERAFGGFAPRDDGGGLVLLVSEAKSTPPDALPGTRDKIMDRL
jgi:hypothetical protein